MKNLGYYNGKMDELDRMTVPMLDRACYFGDGIYDVLSLFGGYDCLFNARSASHNIHLGVDCEW